MVNVEVTSHEDFSVACHKLAETDTFRLRRFIIDIPAVLFRDKFKHGGIILDVQHNLYNVFLLLI